MPAPIAPWMSASEALTIWMLSTAMKAPSVAPITAIQVLTDDDRRSARRSRGGVGAIVSLAANAVIDGGVDRCDCIG